MIQAYTCTYLSKYHLIDLSIHPSASRFIGIVCLLACSELLVREYPLYTTGIYTAMLLVLPPIRESSISSQTQRIHLASALPTRQAAQSTSTSSVLYPIYCNNGLCTAFHFTSRTENHQCTCLISLHSKRISIIYHRSITMNLCPSTYISSPCMCPPTLLCLVFQQAIPTAFQDLIRLRTWETNHT